MHMCRRQGTRRESRKKGLLYALRSARLSPESVVPKPDELKNKNTRTTMKTKVLCSIAAFAVACACVPANAQEDKSAGRQPDTATDTDKEKGKGAKHEAPADENEFVKKAAKGGMTEVKIAQMATEKASDSKVKDLAQQLVKDHTAANQELKTVAAGLKITLPDEAASKEDAKCEQLKQKNGAEFDKAFLQEMEHCHAKDIALFEAGKKVAKSSEVTAFIDKTLPVIKSHAQKIGALQPDSPTSSDSGVSPGKNSPEIPRRAETPRETAPQPDEKK
jgi:putative membrane protein